MNAARTVGIRAICRPEVAPGLRLGGLRVIEAHRPEEVPGLLDAMSDVGLVLVQEELHDPDALRDRLPVVVPFPGPTWRVGAPDERVLEILRRAIGYRVRLR